MFKNLSELIAHGQTAVRRDALQIIQAGIQGADPDLGTRALVKLIGDTLHIGSISFDLKALENIYVVGAGKGSFPIASALEGLLGSRINGGVVVVKEGELRRLKRIEILEAGHPIPNEASVIGAQKVLNMVRQAGKRDLVFAAVTGGASALVTLPPKGITLADIQKMNDLLLKCGATIKDINTVRKHLCLLKGGRLVANIQPAQAVTLTLDTSPEGMPWPDLSLADPSTFQDAINVLYLFEIWESVPAAIRSYLQEGLNHPEWETIKSLSGFKAALFTVGSPVSACEASSATAEKLGYLPVILSSNLEGESIDVGICLAGIAKEVIRYNRPFPKPCAIICAGETTVTIRDHHGSGGPNQEVALAFASKLGGKPNVCCLAIDTDGTDGPTQIAGGISDGNTMERAKAIGLNIAEYLRRHDSAGALTRLGDAVVTGHTGTNVMNLRVIIIGKEPGVRTTE
ncbi:MAG: glycerate kinase type-2 family protein [Syntrophales bacterium]